MNHWRFSWWVKDLSSVLWRLLFIKHLSWRCYVTSSTIVVYFSFSAVRCWIRTCRVPAACCISAKATWRIFSFPLHLWWGNRTETRCCRMKVLLPGWSLFCFLMLPLQKGWTYCSCTHIIRLHWNGNARSSARINTFFRLFDDSFRNFNKHLVSYKENTFDTFVYFNEVNTCC